MRASARHWLYWLTLVSVLLGVAACGGGGGSPAEPPLIQASVVSFPSTAVPPGAVSSGNSVIVAAVADSSTGAAITDATVSFNGVRLDYFAAIEAYAGEVTVDPDSAITLSVDVRGANYAVSGRQFSAYPAITAPEPNATWSAQSANLVAWSGVAPSSSALYALGVLDSSGQWVWPSNGLAQWLSPGTTSYTIPAGSLGVGGHLVLVGVAAALPIPGAAPDSALVVGGFNYVPITVTASPAASLVSIAISPPQPTLGKGKTVQLTATGTYSDNSTRDLTTQVAWSTAAPGIATVGPTGVASGVDFGSTTVTASVGTVSGSTTLSVFQPTPSPAPPLNRSVTYQIDYAHSGRAVFGTPIAFPTAPTWSVTLPGQSSYPLIADGKVFVTTTTSTSNSQYGTYLIALDAQTGNVAWGPVPIAGTYFWSGHAYDNGKIFVVNFDGLLQSFDAATGQPRWARQLPGQYAFTSPPTAVNGVVYVGGAGSGGTLYAVDQANGGLLWTAAVANGDHSSPTVSADGVFVAYPCQVYKFDPLSGANLWHYSGGCSGGGGRTTVYADNRLYVREVGGASALIFDATTGNTAGSFASTPMPALSPQAGYFLFGGVLRAIAPATQQTLWSFSGDGQLVSAPIVIDDFVIIGSSSGNVYALNAANGTQAWVGAAGAAISAPDEHNVTQPLTGFGAGEGLLVVPAGNRLTGWRIGGP